MPLTRDRREWERLSAFDPMFAIASIPGREGRWTPEEFFATGENVVADVVAMLGELGIQPGTGRALDFGCGLGRLTRALSYRFTEAWGIDISSSMVEQARALNADRGGCTFVINQETSLHELPTGAFDLVLSLVTLQHVSDKAAIRSYIREFVRVSRPGGVVVFQLPCQVAARVRFHPRRIATFILDSVPAASGLISHRLRGSQTLNWLPEAEVKALLAETGASLLTVLDDNRVGSAAVPSRLYVARSPT